MKNILVTGGSGKAGRATIKLLLEKNYNVFNVDFVNNPELDVPFTKVDLEDFGDAMEVVSEIDDRIKGIDAVIHQAAIPASGLEVIIKLLKLILLALIIFSKLQKL